jgi:pimeloyl-ACP methyl ester carboxylesterase
MSKISHRIETADGYFLHVEESGQGAPIIFAHEFGGDHRSWRPQVAAFAKDHRCIVYAARGFLPSDVPQTVADYGQDKSTADLFAVADQLGVPAFHLVGLSMGSFTSLMAAAQRPARVLSLTLIGCSSGPCTAADEAEYRAYIEGEIALLEAGRETAAVAKLFFLPKYSPDLNPIEMFFAKLKHWLRKVARRSGDAIYNATSTILPDVSPSECANLFTHAGYGRM